MMHFVHQVYDDIFRLTKKYYVLAMLSMLLDCPCLIIGAVMWYIHYKQSLKRALFREERLTWLTMIAELAVTFITNGADGGVVETKAVKDQPNDSEVVDPDSVVVEESQASDHADQNVANESNEA